MSELVAWLTKILDEDERSAVAQKEWADGWLEPAPRFGPSHGYVGAPVRPTTDQILADIAAKRAILYLHKPSAIRPRENDTVRLLATAYADRPGYREEWHP